MSIQIWTRSDQIIFDQLMTAPTNTLIDYAHVKYDLLRFRHTIHAKTMLIDKDTDKLADKKGLLMQIETKLNSMRGNEFNRHEKMPSMLCIPPDELLAEVQNLLDESENKSNHSLSCTTDRLRAMVNVLSYFSGVEHARDAVVRRLEMLDR